MNSSSDDEREPSPDLPAEAYNDRRLRRLQNLEVNENRLERHRHIHRPEIIDTESALVENEEVAYEEAAYEGKGTRRWESSEEDDEVEDLDEDDIEHRRLIARQKALAKQQQDEASVSRKVAAFTLNLALTVFCL